MPRLYDPDRDQASVKRIWREVGWTKDDEPGEMEAILAASRGYVADVDGAAECMVMTTPGSIRHGAGDLPIAIVAAVTTSRVARKRRLAQRVTAHAIERDVADGAIVSILGMFEQGFYDRLGFGSGSYTCWYAFDPAALRVPGAERAPRRLSVDDEVAVHANRLARHRGHGSCNATPVAFTRAGMLEARPNGFGLGYGDGPDGALSHHFWMNPSDGVEHGPYWVEWMAWQTREQFLELMGLIRNLGDQVALVTMRERPEIQTHDLVRQPIRRRRIAMNGKFDARMRVVADWQARINDVPACLAATRLPADGPVRFNLALTDPIAEHLDGAPWTGVAGDYVVTLGPASSAERGRSDALPTLETSVGAFTRLWLGVRPAIGLAMTDDLRGPASLLDAIDRAVRLPHPEPDWSF